MKTKQTTSAAPSERFRFIVFREKGVWYAVALEYNIVESGDDPQVVLYNLIEAVQGSLAVAKEICDKGACPVYTQEADPEYEAMWQHIQKNSAVPSPYEVYTAGTQYPVCQEG
jgi:hypothetical protein